MKRKLKRYCEDIENIENYEKAKKDNFKGWDCHHRLGTHTSGGERRLVDISPEELKALGMYYHRPASELIFLTRSEHKRLHQEGKPAPYKGKHHSAETKKKMSDSMTGKHHSEEVKKRISAAMKGQPTWMKGKHWKIIDGKRVWL